MAKEVAAVEAEDFKTLVESVRDLADNQLRTRQLTINEVDRKTAWNPEGKRVRLKLKRKVYQNGYHIDENRMTEEEIGLWNQIKPGRYNKRKWEVIQRRDKSVDLRYPNKSVEQRMQLSADIKGGGLAGMLKLIITEQEAQAERRKRGEYDEDE